MPGSNPSVQSRTRAIVLTTQRTGSSFLIDCLGSHPDIETSGEILIGAPDVLVPRQLTKGRFRTMAKILRFARSGAWMPARRMEAFFAGGKAQVRVFKAMYNQVSNPITTSYLLHRADIRILHLRRRNLLKMHVSKLLMARRKRVQAWEPLAVAKIHVDPTAALAALRKARRQYEHFETIFASHPRLQLAYENLIHDQAIDPQVAGAICDFLGVQRKPMKSRLVKVNPNKLADFVTNYDELARVISKTEFAELLDQ